jgi:hypothetical protein
VGGYDMHNVWRNTNVTKVRYSIRLPHITKVKFFLTHIKVLTVNVIMAKKKFNPEDVIGKPYKRGLLPYGGGVARGRIAFAVSEEEYTETMKRLKAIHV